MYNTRPGLGLNTSSLVTAGASAAANTLVPGSGELVSGLLSSLQSVFNFRAGADEADQIVPVQNEIHQGLAQVDQILASSRSVTQLQQAYAVVQSWARDFMGFITSEVFQDGRASEQAANTLMPLLEGTGGYSWPDMRGVPVSSDKWGNPTNPSGSAPGANRLANLAQRIQALGGGVATGPQIVQGGGMGPSLQYTTPGGSYLPQSGWIPPTSPMSQIQTAGITPVGGFSLESTLPLLLVGGLLLLGSGRKKRR